MKRGSTIILSGAVILIGIAVLALCIGLPWILNIGKETNSEFANLKYPVLIGLYATAIPFFFALHQTLKLLSYIDKNIAFSESSVKALKNIKYCAFTISFLCTAGGLPFFYYAAEIEDAPGLVFVGLAIAFAPFVIAVFTSVIQRLLQDAIDIKSENDLTV